MGSEITNIITAILSAIPTEILAGIAIVIVLLVMGYENKKKAEEEAKLRKTRKPGPPSKPKAEE